MEPRFDPAKDAINQDRHQLSLAFGDRLLEDPRHLTIASIRPQDGEARFKLIGSVEGKLYAAVFTWRDGARRFISVRRTNPHEERRYRDPR